MIQFFLNYKKFQKRVAMILQERKGSRKESGLVGFLLLQQKHCDQKQFEEERIYFVLRVPIIGYHQGLSVRAGTWRQELKWRGDHGGVCLTSLLPMAFSARFLIQLSMTTLWSHYPQLPGLSPVIHQLRKYSTDLPADQS